MFEATREGGRLGLGGERLWSRGGCRGWNLREGRRQCGQYKQGRDLGEFHLSRRAEVSLHSSLGSGLLLAVGEGWDALQVAEEEFAEDIANDVAGDVDAEGLEGDSDGAAGGGVIEVCYSRGCEVLPRRCE